jgi:hypothetical protein
MIGGMHAEKTARHDAAGRRMINPVGSDHNRNRGGRTMTTEIERTIGRNRLWVLGLSIALLVAPAVSAGEVTIEIAPATLNLQSHGVVVTVHTDLPYGSVDVYSVYLGGVAINAWKADDRGYFVAKFLMDDIKTIDGLVVNDTNILQFLALTISDEEVWGEDEIMVIDGGARTSGDR